MQRLRAVSSLVQRASALAGRSTLAGQRASACRATEAMQSRSYAVFSTAAVAGAMSGASSVTMRVMGYNVPYPLILGSAFLVAGGVYWWECVAVKHEKEEPLRSYMEAAPHIRSLEMTDQDGKRFNASALFGKYSVLFFGTATDSAIGVVSTMAKAADGVKQRCGTTVTPVFISLDPSRDTPDDLRRVASAAGGVVALTGDADGLLACANKFKKQELSTRNTAARNQESIKHGDAVDTSYVSSYIFVVSPQGDFVSMLARDQPADKMCNQICLSI